MTINFAAVLNQEFKEWLKSAVKKPREPQQVKINMTPEKKQEIIDSLVSKGANCACPRCNGNSFNVLDGYLSHPVTQPSSGLYKGMSVVGMASEVLPAVVIICNQCGYMMQHALAGLGLLSSEKE